MNAKRTSVFENGLIWFGAAVSLAEILTGTYFAPLGFTKGILAVIIGHAIGFILLFSAGLIGGITRKSSMETVKLSFGFRGALFFAFLNVLQLVGWTAIMIYDGAVAANEIFNIGYRFWSIIIGMLIVFLILIGIKKLKIINSVAMLALLILTIVLSFVVFRTGSAQTFSSSSLSFGAAVELSVAMPLSWLPLISDYTGEAEKPVRATAASALTYCLAGTWMYIIGMGAAIFTGESDVAKIMIKAGLGFTGLIIVVFSTTTTTFLDAYSAGISTKSIFKKANGRLVAVFVTLLGIFGAVFLPFYDITDFLYLIGSVFAPMTAILIADFFILKNNSEEKRFDFLNIIVWLLGFIVYRLLMQYDIVIGSTLPDMIITLLLCIAVNKIKGTFKK